MTFDPSGVEDFLNVFNSVKDKIDSFEGCTHVELLQDVNNPNIFFTHSHWVSVEALNQYRDSELLKTTWDITKQFFVEKPEAWSLKNVPQTTPF